jgi:ketosteroid isomerase-like protein
MIETRSFRRATPSEVPVMRSLRFPLLMLVAVAACTTKDARRADTAAPATATLAGAPTADAAAVKQAIDGNNVLFGAAVLKGDTAALAGFYTDDALFMSPNHPAARGHNAIAKSFAGMGSEMKLATFKLQAQDVVVAGDYAVETGAYDFSGTAPKATKPMHDAGKYLVLWKKQADGSYKIVRDIYNTDLPPMK